ncbi:hypothetical protein GQ600_18519 [Phytophthora cactorum]|nr:hypothetical protein GQ600_18519 [Phytophthora cactorum]
MADLRHEKDHKKYESVCGSTWDVDDFVAWLPVKQMYDIYEGVYLFEDEFIHDFLWRMRWLQTSMEFSKYLNTNLEQKREPLDKHIERRIAMESDTAIDAEMVYQHAMRGRYLQRNYNHALYLSIAMNVVDVLAHQIYDDNSRIGCAVEGMTASARSARTVALLNGWRTAI